MNALLKLRETYKNKPGIVFHLQYPTLGMGKSFAPALLSFAFKNSKVFMTFHEFEQFSLIRKMYFLFTSLTNTRYIFTNEYEQEQFARFFPWTKTKSIVIPIGNNISAIPFEQNGDSPQHRLIYFGQIAPNKGIEEYLDTVSCLRLAKNNIPCAIMGATLGSSNDLLHKISSMANQNNIECMFNLSSEDVSKELHKSSIAYLPFPGGVSDKRGSALACLTHGLKLITVHSELTPEWWRETTYAAQNYEESTHIVQKIIASKQDDKDTETVETTLKLALKERKWKHIAEKHLAMYKEL
jgi:glycosyltransferase involved in cell wall biosynthesis